LPTSTTATEANQRRDGHRDRKGDAGARGPRTDRENGHDDNELDHEHRGRGREREPTAAQEPERDQEQRFDDQEAADGVRGAPETGHDRGHDRCHGDQREQGDKDRLQQDGLAALEVVPARSAQEPAADPADRTHGSKCRNSVKSGATGGATE